MSMDSFVLTVEVMKLVKVVMGAMTVVGVVVVLLVLTMVVVLSLPESISLMWCWMKSPSLASLSSSEPSPLFLSLMESEEPVSCL